jgi:hypothetical protein
MCLATRRRSNAPQLADDAMQKHRCERAQSPAMAKQPGFGTNGLNSPGDDLLEGEGGFSTQAMRIRGDGGGHGSFIQTIHQQEVEASSRPTGFDHGIVVVNCLASSPSDGQHLHSVSPGLQQELEPLRLQQISGGELALVAGRGALAVALHHRRLRSEHLSQGVLPDEDSVGAIGGQVKPQGSNSR